MKNLIEYNYNITINELNEENDIISFIFNETKYIFSICNRSINELNDIIDCSKELKMKGITSFDIILNKDNEIITKDGEDNYCLLQIPNNYLEEIDITMMFIYNNKTALNKDKKDLYKNTWDELWSKKIDYYEYQVSELAKEKIVILDSFSYFVGLAENAISIANKVNKENEYGKNDNICLSHRRIFYPNIILNYCNPLSYIFDLEVRDIAEYIKSCFYSNDDPYLEFTTVLKSKQFTNYSYNMLLARLLYPSYYFDIYEDIILGNVNNDKLIPIIKKIPQYEEFLKFCIIELSKYTNISRVDWLLKI